MKAIYSSMTDCTLCLDYGEIPDASTCAKCIKWSREEVDILELGTGLFGNGAIIRKSNGDIESVSIKSLKIIEDKT